MRHVGGIGSVGIPAVSLGLVSLYGPRLLTATQVARFALLDPTHPTGKRVAMVLARGIVSSVVVSIRLSNPCSVKAFEFLFAV